jgi:hypothetical protein
MGECTARPWAGLVLLAAAGSSGAAGEVEPWMPETLPGLVRAVELGIAHSLTPREREALAAGTSEDLLRDDPELHARIRGTFESWTERWIRRARPEIERVPRDRIRRAELAAADVGARLSAYFGARGWTWREPEVIFLPRHLMQEPGSPALRAAGMVVLHYPGVIFAALDPGATLPHTLIHESLHSNKTGPVLGRTLTEGIAEAAASQLALEWGLVSRRALREANAYPKELQAVEYVAARIAERTGATPERALDVLLRAYLTGDATAVEAALGAPAWSAILRASLDGADVRRAARRALETTAAVAIHPSVPRGASWRTLPGPTSHARGSARSPSDPER